MKHVLGCDPGGKTTGVVLLAVPEDDPAYLEDSWALKGSIEAFKSWWDNDLPWWVDGELTVVCETFDQRNIAGVDLSPLRLEGAIRALCLVDEVPFVGSSASGKDTAVPNAALKRLGYDEKAWRSDHHQDRREGFRHAVRYLKNMRHRPTMEKAFPNV